MIRVEFTIYPFVEGMALPGYVQAAVDVLEAEGFEVDVGALGNSVSGADLGVLASLHRAEVEAIKAGATRVVVDVQVQQ